VSDGVNPSVTDTATLSLVNAPPTVAITSPADGDTFDPGATVQATAAIGDPGTNDGHTCSIDWGDGTIADGSVAAGVCSGSHAYAAPGAFTIAITATDDDGGAGNDTASITIANLDACTIHGTAADDRLLGTTEADVICGLDGDDVLIGLEGDDVLVGGPGDDLLRGGAGRDAVDYAGAPVGVIVNLAAEEATGWGTDRLVNIEVVLGSAFDDQLWGDGDRNELYGRAGRDQVNGRGSVDLVDGGPDADILHGGGGNDHVIGGDSPTPEAIDQLFGDDGRRDVCQDGGGLADVRDASCELSEPVAGEDPGAEESADERHRDGAVTAGLAGERSRLVRRHRNRS
jgi:Ca2+-binding RTX toxin-like protein